MEHHPVEQLEARLLKFMYRFNEPQCTGALAHLVGDTEDFCVLALKAAASKGFVIASRGCQAEQRWLITNAGRELVEKHSPSEVADLIKLREEPAVAIAHLAEDELDEWWEELDVECKADAFLQFSLGAGSHVSVDARLAQIPVRGTVAAGAVAQADGCGAMVDELRGSRA